MDMPDRTQQAAAFFLSLLGPAHLCRGDEAVVLPTRKALWLLAYLALEGPSERGVLADLLWDEGGEEQARGNLRAELYRLTHGPAGPALRISKRLIGLDGVDCDVLTYQRWLQEGQVAEAEALYRGELLSGASGGPAFEGWLRTRRDGLARLRAASLTRQARMLEDAGELRRALNTWLSLLAHDELAEEWHREAMRLHALLGERGLALARFERCRTVLAAELALEPLPETAELARSIWAGARAHPAPLQDLPGTLDQLPMTGRDGVRQRLRSVTTGVVALLGEPGVGKTRLATELAQERGQVLTLRGSELSRGTPLAPLTEPLRHALRQGRLDRLHEPWRSELARLLPELGGPEQPASTAGTAAAGRARFLDALTRASLLCLVPSESDPGSPAPGTTLLIDDLQWFDDTTLELCGLILRAPGAPLLIVTARPHELDQAPGALAALLAWERAGVLRRETLGPLAEADLLALVRTLSGSGEGQLFARRLQAVTGGNPLFVLETLRGLLESGEIEVRAGNWLTAYDGLTSDYTELPMAPSVRAAVIARAERLGPEARRVLDAASLADDVFTLRELVGATALDEWTSLDALERAERAGLLSLEANGYRFTHGLIRRALQGALGPSRQALLHRRLADTLIALGGDPLAIAHHLEADPVAAAPWWRQAARNAARLYSSRSAFEQLSRALRALPAGDERYLGWLLERVQLSATLGERGTQAADLTEAAALAFSDLDRGLVLLEQARFQSIAGAPAAAAALAEEAGQCLRRANSETGAYQASLCLAEMAYYQEAFTLALSRSEETVALARRLDPPALIAALNWLGIARDTLLDPEGALDAYAEALGLLVRYPDGYMKARLHNNRATVYGLYGHFVPALADLNEAVALIERGEYRHLEAFVLTTRVRVLRGLGRLDEAFADLDRAARIAQHTESHRLHSHCLFLRVPLLNDLRAYPEALEASAAALEAAGTTDAPSDRVFALAGRSEALLALGRLDDALASSAEALQLLDHTGTLREGLPYFVYLAHVRALTARRCLEEADHLQRRAAGEIQAQASRFRSADLRTAFLALPECSALLGGTGSGKENGGFL